jgi:hypothetical protein
MDAGCREKTYGRAASERIGGLTGSNCKLTVCRRLVEMAVIGLVTISRLTAANVVVAAGRHVATFLAACVEVEGVTRELARNLLPTSANAEEVRVWETGPSTNPLPEVGGQATALCPTHCVK